jgi:hypothetical protein
VNAFTLGRMRHLDLLALWHQRNPDSHDRHVLVIARLSKENLIAQILSPA